MTVKLPKQLNRYQKDVVSWLSRGCIGDVEFSASTYQVQVYSQDHEEEFWVFLQFDEKSRLNDYFCSCEESEEEGHCVHTAVAYLSLFDQQERPLHAVFAQSLWNRLCSIFCQLYGEHPGVLSQENVGTYALQVGTQTLFSLEVQGEDRRTFFERLFFERSKETEETSIKFSNLSEEEIRLWKRGMPTQELRYTLSFWYDLAQWLMVQQFLGRNPIIDFEYSTQEIPERLKVTLPSVRLSFALNLRILEEIIPTLDTIDSPLQLFGGAEEKVRSLTFDASLGVIHVQQGKVDTDFQSGKEMILGDWAYIPKQGFFSLKEGGIAEDRIYHAEEVGHFIEEHYQLFKRKLKGTPIIEEIPSVSYTLYFDRSWDLHVEAYCFEKGDLQQEGVWVFGEWAYLPNKGFVSLEDQIFSSPQLVIPSKEVEGFVRSNQSWIDQQEGFRTHLSGVVTALSYKVTAQNALLFSRKTFFQEEAHEAKDFGQWLYVKGIGFFSKLGSQITLPVDCGIAIHKEQVPLFIRMYREELRLIEHFFSLETPIETMGIHVEVTEEERVLITPEYALKKDYLGKNVRFFGDYTYVEGEGFHRIPSEAMLPERFRYPMILEKENLPQFFTHELEALQQYALSIDPSLLPPKSLFLQIKQIQKQLDGYALHIEYSTGRYAIPFAALWETIQRKERYYFSRGGLIDLHDERFQWIHGIQPSQVDLESNRLVLSVLELIRLNAFDILNLEAYHQELDDLLNFRMTEMPNTEMLASPLRPYQKVGVKWLWFLYTHQLSGLLCDDMGLGKTHQAMALMAAAREERGHLIICPTSVIYHWKEKLERYLPTKRVCVYHGGERQIGDFANEYDVLLTSYGIWRRDQTELSKISFEIAIFDEIHAAKNQKSRLHHSLLTVKAVSKFGLTGTPIENRLRELKALFDLILPNYMPKDKEYRRFFTGPIEKEGSKKRRELLSRYIHPFILRRRKEDVLTDLPEKSEEIAHCELSSEQRFLYTDVLHKVREGIYAQMEEGEAPLPYVHIFSALSSLKQICNHPAAFMKRPEEFQCYTSGKWDLFVELLSEALESGQKVVIFSQYLAMLDIFEYYLRENGINHTTIRGATQDRGERIKRFNTDPECRVFVGSLQAAGLGIDLTAGSVVIHYDRWWNAAREDQATDRVHRIGQQRGVQVFKLVTKNTFEERIDEMINKKGKLMEEVIGVDDFSLMKSFNKEEILQLFADLPEF